MNAMKITYWITTGIFTLIMLFSVVMYILANGAVQETFTALGYPTHIIYPLAGAKLLGVIAILGLKNHTIKEWAYAGFFFVTILGVTAHVMARDGNFVIGFVALVMIIGSYASGKKMKYI